MCTHILFRAISFFLSSKKNQNQNQNQKIEICALTKVSKKDLGVWIKRIDQNIEPNEGHGGKDFIVRFFRTPFILFIFYFQTSFKITYFN